VDADWLESVSKRLVSGYLRSIPFLTTFGNNLSDNRALLYESRFKDLKGELMTRCMGPYLDEKCYDNGYVKMMTRVEEKVPLLVTR